MSSTSQAGKPRRRLSQDVQIHRLVGHDFPQAGILFLRGLQPVRLCLVQRPVVPVPSMVPPLALLKLREELSNGGSPGHPPLRFAQLPDDLSRCVLRSLHLRPPTQ